MKVPFWYAIAKTGCLCSCVVCFSGTARVCVYAVRELSLNTMLYRVCMGALCGFGGVSVALCGVTRKVHARHAQCGPCVGSSHRLQLHVCVSHCCVHVLCCPHVHATPPMVYVCPLLKVLISRLSRCVCV